MAVDDELYGRYSSALEKSCGLARRDVSRVVEAFAGDPDALRDALLTSYPAIVEKYGDLAASSAMEFYEESRELARAPGLYSPVMADADPRDVLERNVRYSMGDYYGTGDKAALASRLGDSAQRHVMNAAERTLVANAKRDRAHPRWALVPHAGACPYCMMLGSRGFAYRSKDTAMASRHDGCGCTPVVDFDRKSPKLKGYDPDALYDQWKHPEIYDGMPDETRAVVSSLRVYEASGKARYHKPISSFIGTDDERDLFAHKAILDAGRELDVLKEDAPDGYSNIDLLIDGVKYEVKSPVNSGLRVVEQNLRKAKRQFEKQYGEPQKEVTVVFNGAGVELEDEVIARGIEREMARHGIDRVIQIRKDGTIREM